MPADERDDSVNRMQEYSAAVKVFLSTIDDLVKRKYSKEESLLTAKQVMAMFFEYRAGIDYSQQEEQELQGGDIILRPEDLG